MELVVKLFRPKWQLRRENLIKTPISIGTAFRRVVKKLSHCLDRVIQDLWILATGCYPLCSKSIVILLFEHSFLIYLLCSCYLAATMQVVFSTNGFCSRSVTALLSFIWSRIFDSRWGWAAVIITSSEGSTFIFGFTF